MTYTEYKDKVKKISNSIKKDKRLITTNRKGHNHRDLNFKTEQQKIDTSKFNCILGVS